MKSNQKDHQRKDPGQNQGSRSFENRYDEVEIKKANDHIRKLKQVNKDLHSVTDKLNSESRKKSNSKQKWSEGSKENRDESQRSSL